MSSNGAKTQTETLKTFAEMVEIAHRQRADRLDDNRRNTLRIGFGGPRIGGKTGVPAAQAQEKPEYWHWLEAEEKSEEGRGSIEYIDDPGGWVHIDKGKVAEKVAELKSLEELKRLVEQDMQVQVGVPPDKQKWGIGIAEYGRNPYERDPSVIKARHRGMLENALRLLDRIQRTQLNSPELREVRRLVSEVLRYAEEGEAAAPAPPGGEQHKTPNSYTW